MKKIVPIALYVLLVVVVVNNDMTSASVDETRATPAEVVRQVKSAARLLQRDGFAALDVLRNRDSSYVWKDTYSGRRGYLFRNTHLERTRVAHTAVRS